MYRENFTGYYWWEWVHFGFTLALILLVIGFLTALGVEWYRDWKRGRHDIINRAEIRRLQEEIRGLKNERADLRDQNKSLIKACQNYDRNFKP